MPTTGDLIGTVTTAISIPWRPEADPTCPNGTAWKDANGACWNGKAFDATFDLAGLGLVAAPTVGTDVDADAISWNTSYGPFYADTGAAGVGTFRHDTAWAPYVPAIGLSAV